MIKSVSLSKRKDLLKLKGKVKWEGDSVKQKPYPVPDEDNFTPPNYNSLGDKMILLEKIKKGIQDADKGRVISENDLEKRIEEWLKK